MGCPKSSVDCRISVGVTWTRSGLRTLWTGLEMMKECGPGVNILTLSKYYCFWVFLGALYCLVLGFWVSSKGCGLNVGISWYLVLSGSSQTLLRVSCQNKQCFWMVLAPEMSIKQPTLKSRRVPKPRNDNISGNGFLQHISWCRGHISEKWRVLSLNASKGRVYREESPISVGILTLPQNEDFRLRSRS